MKVFKSRLAVLALASLILGCGSVGNLYTYKGSGFLYTHKIEPLTHHYNSVQTGQVNKDASGNSNQLSYDSVALQWGDNAIGEMAKKAGIQTIYYADLETQSILLGLWSRYKVHIYGSTDRSQASLPVPEKESP